MKIETRIARLREIAEDIREVTLVRRDGGNLPVWTPGSHIQVLLPLGGEPGIRAYSLIGDPSESACYRFAVQVERQGRGGSRYLHQRVTIGDRLVIAAPANSFPLAPPDGHPVDLVAGGVGITPLIAMMRALLRRGDRFRLHIFARTRSRVPFLDRLEDEFAAMVSLRIGLDQAASVAELARIASEAELCRARVYVCGPGAFVTAMTDAAAAVGIDPGRVATERFATPARSGENRPFRIRLGRSGRVIEVPPRVSGLEALEQTLGCILPCDCRAGFCGTCAQTVIAGEVDHRDTALGPVDRSRGLACICISRAAGEEITLDL